MKNIIFLFLIGATTTALSQEKKEQPKTQIVEAACGQCQFGMQEKGCDLAVRIEGKSYFVEGTSIDEHGDAHAEDGFCNTIRKAEVSGTIVEDHFKATSFKLIEEEK
ncbi:MULTISPECIES: DUF6370 family protein [Flavobacterium]|uniref:DUF6370 family protein n=1 Tax=Flavobacterium TaxID=237 RepID=UPI001FCCBBA3|nr:MULTISPECIES: DUF6370 family protein [Flavobacterium]UOK42766.1 DUF6370 family protein [Flavobacterium enshiense]